MKKALLPLFLLCAALTVHAQDAAPSPAALKPLSVSGFVTLDEIVSDFRNSPDAALQKYGGQQVIVYGRVGQLTSPDDADGALVVYLQQFNNTTPDVKAIFNMDNIPQHSSIEVSSDGTQATLSHRTRRTDEINANHAWISVDERIGIKGGFSGFVAGDIVIKDCRRVEKKHLEQLMQGPGAQ